MDNAVAEQTEMSREYPSYMKHPSEGICQLKEDEGPFEPKIMIQVVIVMFAIVVIAIAIYYFCRQWSRGNENGSNNSNRPVAHYNTSNSSDGSRGRTRKRVGGSSSRDRSGNRSDRSSGYSSDGGSSGRRYGGGSGRKQDR